MKAGVFAVAVAAIAGGADARKHARHAHDAFHNARAVNLSTASPETCGCTTSYFNVTGAATLVFPPAPSTTALPSTSIPAVTTSAAVKSSTSPAQAPIVPTPNPTTIETPGVYTIPATTLTLTESTTVCAATSTPVTSAGTYTIGGVTTVVSTSTTVVCPYASVSTNSGGVVTSTILTTTYVCPAAGTYTIAPITTTVNQSTVLVYPTPASYAPGTYTAPELTTTITDTSVVVYCPFTSPGAASSTSAPAPASTTASDVQAVSTSAAVSVPSVSVPAVESSSTYASAPAASTTVSVPAVSVPVVESSSTYASAPAASTTVEGNGALTNGASSSTSVAVSTPSSTSTSSGIGNLIGGLLGLGSETDQWAITYTPYSSDGQCLSEAQVYIDVALIALKGFSTVRVYSTDCSTLEYIGGAAKVSGIKIILGVYISSTGITGAADQVTAITSWAQWDLVELISIGNEAVYNGYVTASELASFISSTKASFSAAGYTGPCTTTEPLNIWQESTAELCDVVDVVGCNIHPFFNAATAASDAGSFVASQLSIVDNLCSGKSGITLETGWPTAGECNGLACPGKDEQSTALASIKAEVGGKSCILSFANDLWKSAGEFGCEQSWGAIDFY